MGKVCLFVICMYCSIHHLSAQQEEQQTQPVQQPLVTQDDILGNMNVDYAKIKLPPLSVLYENARSTPSLQILEKEKQLQKKILWGIMTLLAAAKGYWQKNKGFDSTELSWLWAYGARTHFIHSGIRYFSFFTDAGLFGASMGLSCTVFTLTFFYTKNLFLRLFYLIVGMAGFYGLLISGTRSAIAVPIAGLGLFLFLSKSWKIGIISFILLAGGIGMLKYTKIGENNKLIRRMRTVFDTEDQSMMARFENQKALNAYMDEMPFGIGMGAIDGVVPPHNKYYFVSICPSDSSLVDVWKQMGIVGLCVFLGMHAILFLSGSYILLFKIRNPEIRGPLTGMLCGCAGILVASYANMVYFQFPNGILIYSCFTFVFLGPYLDKQYSEIHGLPTA